MKKILSWNEEIYLDNMNDDFLKDYGGWPIGLFAFIAEKFVWRATPKFATIDIIDIIEFMKNIE
jgi:hypothetical protein